MSDEKSQTKSVSINGNRSSSNNSSQSKKAEKTEYWTKERMANVKASPMPKV